MRHILSLILVLHPHLSGPESRSLSRPLSRGPWPGGGGGGATASFSAKAKANANASAAVVVVVAVLPT